MKVLILQTISPGITEYCRHSIPTNIDWAIRSGHEFLLYRDETFCHHPAWLKIDAFEHIAYEHFDRIWVLDADCIINNPKISLADIIGSDDADIIVSENGPNGGRLINSGSIIYKPKVIPQLLRRWRKCVRDNAAILNAAYWDQELINDWYEDDSSLFSVRSVNVLNSNWNSMEKSDFVHHYMSRPTNEKSNLLRRAALQHLKKKYFLSQDDVADQSGPASSHLDRPTGATTVSNELSAFVRPDFLGNRQLVQLGDTGQADPSSLRNTVQSFLSQLRQEISEASSQLGLSLRLECDVTIECKHIDPPNRIFIPLPFDGDHLNFVWTTYALPEFRTEGHAEFPPITISGDRYDSELANNSLLILRSAANLELAIRLQSTGIFLIYGTMTNPTHD